MTSFRESDPFTEISSHVVDERGHSEKIMLRYNSSELGVEDMVLAFRNMLLAMQFHPENVDEYLPLEKHDFGIVSDAT